MSKGVARLRAPPHTDRPVKRYTFFNSAFNVKNDRPDPYLDWNELAKPMGPVGGTNPNLT
jgi:hypothetical protein